MRVSIDETFDVDASPDAVWLVLQDPYNVVPCVPGARITATLSEDTYKGTVTMKLGPVSVRFGGDIRITSMDQDKRTMVLEGNGRDARGKGNAAMRLEGSVSEREGGGATVATSMTLTIRGRLAQFGGRLIKEVSARVFDQFVACFREHLKREASGDAPESNSGSGIF